MAGAIKSILRMFIAFLLLLSQFVLPPHFASADEEPPKLLITEVATASVNSAAEEFVEIYNPNDSAVELDGILLQYKSAGGTSWLTKATISGNLDARSFYIIATSDYLEVSDQVMSSGLAASGGHLRLYIPAIDEKPELILDLLGWGNAESAEGDEAAFAPSNTESLQRCANSEEIEDTNNNANDFKVYADYSIGEISECSADTTLPEEPVITATCEGIIITEILPNPSGSDSGAEFIELYNPTVDFIDLKGCGLQVNSSSIHFFGETLELAPEKYLPLYNDATNFTLPNAAGGTVFLLSPELEELHSVKYGPALDDDVAWAWFGNNNWEVTYKPTPGSANILQPTKPCPAGQIRSEETGRCRSKSNSTTLAPCAPDQERNPETNRCRKISTSTLTPCKPGQERNPETNRCRKIGSATANLKPCSPGQERNPATNRCRKIANTNSAGANVAGAASVPTSPLTTGVVATAVSLSLLYGAYEFRTDIRNRLHGLREYFRNRTHSGS